MSAKYDTIPSLDQWKSDSSVFLAVRNHDEGLTRIDRLVGDYNITKAKGHYRACFVLCDLFLAINFWVKRHDTIITQANRSLPFKANLSVPSAKVQPGYVSLSTSAIADNKKRYPAVMNLFDAVVRTLKKLFGAAALVEIENNVIKLFGVDMKPTGYDTDASKNMRAFSDDQLAQYRVWFKNGRAFQIPWWQMQPSLKLELANSQHGYDAVKRPGCEPASKDYSAFVMTMDLEMYMTKHSVARGLFHSSYTNQKPVLMAGTILIRHGLILAVRTDSGHYQPNMHDLRKFLRELSMLGVQLSQIAIFDHMAVSQGKADRFLANGNNFKFQPLRILTGSYVDA